MMKMMSLCVLTLHFSFIHKKGTDCTSEPDAGVCFARMPRFYFDKYDNKCRMFTYGGCGGNKNNYKTRNECYEACGKGNLCLNLF